MTQSAKASSDWIPVEISVVNVGDPIHSIDTYSQARAYVSSMPTKRCRNASPSLRYLSKWMQFLYVADLEGTSEEPSNPLTETYVYQDNHIIVFAQRVTWDEAETMCSSYHARLVVLDSPDKASFLAQTMSESNIEMDDIWIGGRSSRGSWWWSPTGDLIPLEAGPDNFPPWARLATHRSKQCLAMGRHGHENPLFVDLDCRLLKSFVCEKSKKVELARPVPTKWVKVNGTSLLILYHGRVSWMDAVAYCRQQGHRLAVIPGPHVVDLLDHAMKHARPDFENLWIGGAHRYDSWLWVPTGEPIISHPDDSNFPPWRLNISRTDHERGCLVLDRHTYDHPVFLETSCDRRRDFVCEEYKGQNESTWTPAEVKFVHRGRHMILHMQDKSWNAASDICWSAGSRLVTLEDSSTVRDIMEAMAEHPNEPTHVWIGGELRNDTWRWSKSGEEIPSADGHEPDLHKKFPPWCEWDKDPEASCLNLDRREHSKPMMYGLGCRNKQPFICEVDCRDPGLVPHGNWTCSSEIAPVVLSPEPACELECDPNYVLVGSNVVQCLPQGWVGHDNSTSFPRCLCARVVARSMIRNLQAYGSKGLLFVLDNLRRGDGQRLPAALQFISGIVRAFPLSSSRPFGLISFPAKKSVLLPYTQTDTCEVLRKLTTVDLSISKMKRALAFEQGMKLAYEQITDNQGGNQTLVFFITDRKYVGQYKKIVKLLKDEDHVIIVINIGNDDFSYLPAVASTGMRNQLYFYGYTELQVFTETALHVTAESFLSTNCTVDPVLPDLELEGVEIPKLLEPFLPTTAATPLVTAGMSGRTTGQPVLRRSKRT
ncbi:uncharacterized protein [Anabrus simplex]|uniref:uncharacterized protein n=1 Tax=Anabrus simplex TaxID=316456 RepID=UPI0035A3B1F1